MSGGVVRFVFRAFLLFAQVEILALVGAERVRIIMIFDQRIAWKGTPSSDCSSLIYAAGKILPAHADVAITGSLLAAFPV